MTPAADGGPRCAVAARQREDPQLGTAPVIRRWLLVEHPGPWPVEALTTPDFPPDLQATLTGAARAVAGRVVLIRRPGRAGQARDVATRAWAVVVEGGVHWGRWGAPDDLRDAAAALRHPPQALAHDPLFLVCAHGLHDTCCALQGRSVAAALAQLWPDATWECSHVGGCRFAPNVIVLPDGVYYGTLEAAGAADVVRRHVGGELVAEFLRGLTRYPPPAQVAVGTIHHRWGPLGLDDVVVHAVEQQAPDRWIVDLSVTGHGDRRLTIVASSRPLAHLTCRAAQATAALQYDVVEPF